MNGFRPKYVLDFLICILLIFVIFPPALQAQEDFYYHEEFQTTGCWRVREDQGGMLLGVEVSSVDLSSRLGGIAWQSALQVDVNLSAQPDPAQNQTGYAQIDSASQESGCPGQQWLIPNDGQITARLYLPDDAPQGLILSTQFFLQYVNPAEWHSSDLVYLEPGREVILIWDAGSPTWRDWETKRLVGTTGIAVGLEFRIAQDSTATQYNGPIYIDHVSVTTGDPPPDDVSHYYYETFNEGMACWRIRTDGGGMPLGESLSLADLSADLGDSWRGALRLDVNMATQPNPARNQLGYAHIDAESLLGDCVGHAWTILNDHQISARLYLPPNAPEGLVLKAEFFAQFINPDDWYASRPVFLLRPGEETTLIWSRDSEVWPGWVAIANSKATHVALGIEFRIDESSTVSEYAGPIFVDEVRISEEWIDVAPTPSPPGSSPTLPSSEASPTPTEQTSIPPLPEIYEPPVIWDFKGATLAAYWNDSYTQPNAYDTVDYMQQAGVNTVAVIVSWYQENMESNDIWPNYDCETPTDESLITIIRYIHDKGMKVMLKPHIEPLQGWTSPYGGWRGVIRPANRDAWFTSFEAFITHYAEIAAQEQVELFSIGTEMVSMTMYEADQVRWGEIAGQLREIYSGALLYSAHEYEVLGGEYGESAGEGEESKFEADFEPLPASFWANFDYAGATFYYDIYSPNKIDSDDESDKANPGLDVLLSGWYSNDVSERRPEHAYLMHELTQWQQEHELPVILSEIGYRSIDYAAYHPFAAAPGEPNDEGLSAEYNGEAQATAYEAAFRMLGGKEWLAGAFWWQFIPLSVHIRECGVDVDPSADVSYTPCGRPAAEILSRWYAGARVPPDLPPAYIPPSPNDLLGLSTLTDETLYRTLRVQTSGDVEFTLDDQMAYRGYPQSLHVVSRVPCGVEAFDKRWEQIDFIFSEPQDFSLYSRITLIVKIDPERVSGIPTIIEGEVSISLLENEVISVGPDNNIECLNVFDEPIDYLTFEEWQSSHWFGYVYDWGAFTINLQQGIPAFGNPFNQFDLVIPEWTEPVDQTLDLTNIIGFRLKTLTLGKDCAVQPASQFKVWIGAVYLE